MVTCNLCACAQLKNYHIFQDPVFRYNAIPAHGTVITARMSTSRRSAFTCGYRSRNDSSSTSFLHRHSLTPTVAKHQAWQSLFIFASFMVGHIYFRLRPVCVYIYIYIYIYIYTLVVYTILCVCIHTYMYYVYTYIVQVRTPSSVN